MTTLLVIDDDPVVRDLLHQLLSEKYECDTADRADQALECLEFQEYDVIITDIFMPGLSGLQILKRIQERHLTTPVIVISGKGDDFQEFFKEMGAFACLTKPFPLEALELAITQAIAQHQQSALDANGAGP